MELVVARVAVLGLVRRGEARVERRGLHLREARRVRTGTQGRAAALGADLDDALLLLRLLRRNGSTQRQPRPARTPRSAGTARLRSSVLGLSASCRQRRNARTGAASSSAAAAGASSSAAAAGASSAGASTFSSHSARRSSHHIVAAPASDTQRNGQQRGAAAGVCTAHAPRCNAPRASPEGDKFWLVPTAPDDAGARGARSAGAGRTAVRVRQEACTFHTLSSQRTSTFVRSSAPGDAAGFASPCATAQKNREAACSRSASNGMRCGMRADARADVSEQHAACRKLTCCSTHRLRHRARLGAACT